MEFFPKIVTRFQELAISHKTPPLMFNWVLNTPLYPTKCAPSSIIKTCPKSVVKALEQSLVFAQKSNQKSTQT